jgi:hypothetical protein
MDSSNQPPSSCFITHFFDATPTSLRFGKYEERLLSLHIKGQKHIPFILITCDISASLRASRVEEQDAGNSSISSSRLAEFRWWRGWRRQSDACCSFVINDLSTPQSEILRFGGFIERPPTCRSHDNKDNCHSCKDRFKQTLT